MSESRDLFSIRLYIDGMLYDVGEFAWDTRPNVVLLPDGRAVLLSYAWGRDTPSECSVETPARATVAENRTCDHRPDRDAELAKVEARRRARTCPGCGLEFVDRPR